MIVTLRNFLSENGFTPHGVVYLWRRSVPTLHLVSDALVTLAFFSIPFTPLHFVRDRRDLELQWVFVCLAMFVAVPAIDGLSRARLPVGGDRLDGPRSDHLNRSRTATHAYFTLSKTAAPRMV